MNGPDARLAFESFGEFARAVKLTGLSTRAVARRIGVNSSDLRAYMRGHRECPYPVQYTVQRMVPCYEVQTLIGNDWENIWCVDDKPQTFGSLEDAEAEIDEFLDDLHESGMTPDRMRVVEI